VEQLDAQRNASRHRDIQSFRILLRGEHWQKISVWMHYKSSKRIVSAFWTLTLII